MTGRGIWNRLRSDFLMRSRLGAYRSFLASALAVGYRVTSVGGFWALVQAGELDPGRRLLVLRHDVDTDPRTANAMWLIDRDLGIETSYFFRLSTLTPPLMAEIAAAGSEASYHYEEIATVAKRRGLATAADVVDRLPEARDLFAANIDRLRRTTGLPMRVVASHGDFVNRRLGVPNWLILDEPDFRREVGVELETYDRAYLDKLPSRHSDTQYPALWEPTDPAVAIRDGVPVISVLVHPRQWRADRIGNVRDDLERLVGGWRYALTSRQAPSKPRR